MGIPRAGFHGVDLGGPAAARLRKGHSGATFYDEDTARLLVFDARMRGLVSLDGSPVIDTRAGKIYVSDHFKATPINAAFNVNKGVNAQALNFAADATVPSGAVKGRTGNAGDTVANDAIAISFNAPVQVDLTKSTEFSVGLLVDSIAALQLFVGFTDVLPAATLEAPFTLATVTLTSVATDAAGILLDTAATVDTHRLVSVANDVDGAVLDTAKLISPAVFYDFHVRINPDGSVNFVVQPADGSDFQLAAAKLPPGSLRTGVNLYPIVQATARTTTSINVSLDYFRLHQYGAA